jgi:3-hydroxyacyl-[acyl-carrier-protein] dehydratase
VKPSLLPHRYPMVLVDKILNYIPHESIEAIKCLSSLDPYFQGHFPDNPIFPGVYYIEGLAQTAGLLVGHSLKEAKPSISIMFLLTGVQNAKFRKPSVPGDTLHYHVKLLRSRQKFFWFSGLVKVEQDIIAEVDFSGVLADSAN